MASYRPVLYMEFNYNSYLKPYLMTKFPYVPTYFPFHELVWAMKSIISNERMYDPQNPAIVLCSLELESVLNKSAFHHASLVQILRRHIVPSHAQIVPKKSVPKFFYWQSLQQITVPFRFNKAPIMSITPSPHERFMISPQFRSVLAQVPTFDQNEKIFSFTYLKEILSHYLALKDIVDYREKDIFLVYNDPLGYIFKVMAFHSDQINFLLIKQLTPVRRSLRIYNFQQEK